MCYQRRACDLSASCVVPASCVLLASYIYIYIITARVAPGILHVEEDRVSLVINGRGGRRGGENRSN